MEGRRREAGTGGGRECPLNGCWFNVMPPVLPSGLEAFTEHVIPLLRQRGVFRTEYTGRRG